MTSRAACLFSYLLTYIFLLCYKISRAFPAINLGSSFFRLEYLTPILGTALQFKWLDATDKGWQHFFVSVTNVANAFLVSATFVSECEQVVNSTLVRITRPYCWTSLTKCSEHILTRNTHQLVTVVDR